MRARGHRSGAGNAGAAAVESRQDEADCNGKDKPKFKRPPMAAFKLPPPPKMASLSALGSSISRDNTANGNPHHAKDDSVDIADNGIAALQPAVPAVSIPPPSSTSALHQRAKRNPQADASTTALNASNATATSGSGTVNAPAANYYPHGRESYTNTPYPTQQQYQQPSNYSQSSHPYKPSSWYATARNSQRKEQKTITVFAAAIVTISLAFVWWVYQYEMSHPNAEHKRRHHRDYHHHDRHHDFQNMMGLVDSPMGFAMEVPRGSYRQLEQKDRSSEQTKQAEKHTLFSMLPVTTLSNDRILPYVGFGVSSHSVDHKEIPTIVSTLLQYASSETEGGGGIAMIDAVIDEDRKLENTGGSLQYSISNKVVERYEEEEEKLESSMGKTVVALVGRAIGFFGKQRNKELSLGGTSGGSPDSYDYDNRFEVHLLVGLSGPDLGVDNTIAALRDIFAELDGLIHTFPKDMMHTDLSDWNAEAASKATVDHHVDVRLHVLLRLNHCHNKSFKVAACSDDEETNRDLLDRWIGSYSVLEKLYAAKIIHGVGIDGIHGDDIRYLLRKCKIKPQLYRGDVAQALDIYGRRMGEFKNEHIASLLKEENITFLASNVAGHILERKPMAPNAYALLQNLGGVLYRAHYEKLSAQGKTSLLSSGHKGEGQYYTVPRLVLSYLVRHKVVVLPHAYKAEHLADDAPESVGLLANFLSERRIAEIGLALRRLLTEEDLPEDHGLGMEGEDGVAAVFHNQAAQDVEIHPIDKDGKVLVYDHHVVVKSGKSMVVVAKQGDVFGAFHNFQKWGGPFTVSAESGGANDFTIPDPTKHNGLRDAE